MSQQQGPPGDGTDGHPPPRTAESMNREQYQAFALRRLTDVLVSKMDEVTRNDPSNRMHLNPDERRLLSNIQGVGLYQGLAAGALTFLFLRSSRSFAVNRIQRMVEKTRQPSSPFRSLNDTTTPASGATPPSSSSSTLGSFFHLATDMIVSVMMGSTTMLLLVDHPKVVHTMAKVPLLPGQSRLSQEFCPVIQSQMKELRRLAATPEQSNVLDYAEIHSAADSSSTNTMPGAPLYLSGLVHFDHNCRLRGAHEDRLRQQQGLGPEFPVSIPEPGVVVTSNVGDDAPEFGSADAYLGWDESESSFGADDDNNNNNNSHKNNEDWFGK